MESVRGREWGGWSGIFSEERRNQRHELPKLVGHPIINYDNLKVLCGIEGLGQRDKLTNPVAHEQFMSNYRKIFQRSSSLLSLKPLNTRQKKLEFAKHVSVAKEMKIPHDKGLYPHLCEGFNPMISHNISDHLAKLHKQTTIITSQAEMQEARIKAIRKLLRKLPFERKSKENEALWKHLQYFPELADQVPPQVLKQLCAVMQFDRWTDEDYVVFGNTGLHMILRGSVVPQTSPVVSPPVRAPLEFRSPTPIIEDEEFRIKRTLNVGECFGTLSKIEGREPNSRVLSVVTQEPCEFLKISTSDYEKVIQIIHDREEEQKLSLAHSCHLFHGWPKLSLKKIAGLIKWRRFPAGQILVSEGERCEVMGFIKKGQCLLRRQITVAHTFPNGLKEKRAKSVLIGKLHPGDSFGETTVLKDLPMPCSVVTDSHVVMGTISTLDFYDLDDVTKSLLVQSYSVMDANLTEEVIQKEYIEQEKEKEWANFKSKVVNDVLHYRGIQPGCSKWSRNPSRDSV